MTITDIPAVLYIAQLRPTSGASSSTGSGVATILISPSGTAASVSVSFSNLTSDEVVAHLAIGGDMNNGTYVLNLPQGQVMSLAWTPTAAGAYSAAQVVSALQNGNLYVEIDSATYPSGELGGQFITGAGSQVFTPPAAPPAINLSTVSAADAPRFLTQATFGPTTTDIATLQSQGYSAWITNQMAVPETSHRAATDADANAFPPTGQFVVTQNNRQAAWWKIVVTGPDQLRQRVAFALSEIFVTSDVASQLANQPDGLADYYDLLANDAFGNFRQLLQDVTLSPAMGNYLNMLENAAANPAKGTAADENYAREVQQLFTIGLNELQPDGTLVLDSNGLPIPTYNQNEIVQTANVFTGWGYYSTATNPSFYGTAANFDQPMMLYPNYHDNTQKTIINNIVLPANEGGAADLKAELDALFNHPNTGPFICAQLIQRLVTSNPSPGYVYRVAQVFDNDGTGTRGNLAAVVKAILLDYEARSLTLAANASYGKLKEPLLRMTAIYRAFGASAADGRFAIFNPQTNLDQAALRSPTVFNFFDPGYVQQGALASAGLLAPEFEITDASTAISVPNNIYSAIYYSTPPASTTITLEPRVPDREFDESDRHGCDPEPAPVRQHDEHPDPADDRGGAHCSAGGNDGHGARPGGPLPCHNLARCGRTTMNNPDDLSRRRFIGKACAAVGATGMLSALAQIRMIGALAADSAPTDYKALVCLFLYGGNDSNNLLIPTDNANYNIYAADRTVLALPQKTRSCPSRQRRTATGAPGASTRRSPSSRRSSARASWRFSPTPGPSSSP